jgi:hypothetical protein
MKLIFEMYRATSKAKGVPKSQKLILNSNDNLYFHKKAEIVAKLRKISRREVEDWRKTSDELFGTVQELFGRAHEYDEHNPCGVTLTVYSPTRKRIDPDNFQPSLKALMDGITDSGLWSDDNHEIVKFTKYQYGGLSGSKAYRMELEIEEVS